MILQTEKLRSICSTTNYKPRLIITKMYRFVTIQCFDTVCWVTGICPLKTKSKIPTNSLQQESRAIAKKTARCALYMDALKNLGSPWLRPRLVFPKLLMGFCCNRSYESACKI